MYWEHNLTNFRLRDYCAHAKVTSASTQLLITLRILHGSLRSLSMLGVATASPFPLTHNFNGQLLLELSGFAISDSLTTITSTQKDQKNEQQQTGAQLHNNYPPLYMLTKHYLNLIALTRQGQTLSTLDGNTGVVSAGSSHFDKPGESLRSSVRIPVCSTLTKCL